MTITLRSQQLAGRALADISQVAQENYKDDYARICLKFPYLVLANGLMQAVAFLADKAIGDKPKHKACQRFLADLSRIIEGDQHHHADILVWLPARPLPEYMQATRLALEASIWYKRFAISMLGADPAKEGGA